MIFLRELKEKDAPLMLEWMHDDNVQKSFQKNMKDITISGAKKFCYDSKFPKKISSGQNMHFAIINEGDEYLGTISLKNFDLLNKMAEYAIVLRKKVYGKKIAKRATILLLKKAFYDYKLHKVYLNVLDDNISAIRLYKSCGFICEGKSRDHLLINGKYKTVIWYSILKKEFDELNTNFY